MEVQLHGKLGNDRIETPNGRTPCRLTYGTMRSRVVVRDLRAILFRTLSRSAKIKQLRALPRRQTRKVRVFAWYRGYGQVSVRAFYVRPRSREPRIAIFSRHGATAHNSLDVGRKHRIDPIIAYYE